MKSTQRYLWEAVIALVAVAVMAAIAPFAPDPGPELQLEEAVGPTDIWFDSTPDHTLWTWYLRGEPIWEGTLTELAEQIQLRCR